VAAAGFAREATGLDSESEVESMVYGVEAGRTLSSDPEW
jgi:hypothetical protein